MKKVLCFVLALTMVFALCACGGEKAPAEEAPAEEAPAEEAPAENAAPAEEAAFKTAVEGVLSMATEATFPPYEFYDGDKLVGIDVDVAAAIAEKLGLELEVVDIAFDSIIPGVQTGKYDIGMAGMTVNEERLKQINFTDSYAKGVQVVIVKEGGKIASVDDLFAEGADNVVGTQTGTTGFLYASGDIQDAGLGTVKGFAKTTDAVEALKNGQVDCVILDKEPAKTLTDAANADGAGLMILESAYADEDYAISVSKENDALKDAVNAALKELTEDGTVQKIVDSYIK